MNTYHTIKGWLKHRRWTLRRWAISLRWGSSSLNTAPAILGNAMPKSGSHLIIQVLRGLTHLGPFVNTGLPPVNRDEANQKLPETQILANIQRMRPGDIGYGYIGAQEPFLSVLTKPGRATVFMYRDPRDMLISHIFYATQIHRGHWMRRYYTEELNTMEQRIQAAIQGVDRPGSELTPIRARYEGYMGWLEQSGVLCMRFEDLILERNAALGRLLDYLAQHGFIPRLTQQEAIVVLNRSIVPKRSGTFRKGTPGNWREHFTPANKKLFKELAGDLLVQLGYEKDNEW